MSLAYLAGYLSLPITGIVMLIIGIAQRTGSRTNAAAPAPHAHPGAWPSSQHHHRAHPYPLQPPHYGPLSPPPRSRAGTPLIVAGAVVVIITMLGAVGRVSTASHPTTSPGRIDVGDCLTAENLKRSGTLKPIDCGDPQANFELAAMSGSAQCPDKPISDTAYVYLTTADTTMCFIPVLAQGACFRADSVYTVFDAAECADRSAGAKLLRVAKRIDGSTDKALCPTATKSLAYPQPARLYCLTTVTST